jgi:hypothetical protein
MEGGLGRESELSFRNVEMAGAVPISFGRDEKLVPQVPFSPPHRACLFALSEMLNASVRQGRSSSLPFILLARNAIGATLGIAGVAEELHRVPRGGACPQH